MTQLVTVQMRQFGRGWAYQLYNSADNPTAAITNAFDMRQEILDVHDKGTTIEEITARDVDTGLGDQKEVLVDNNFVPNADVVTTAARIRLQSATNIKRSLWLKGLADLSVRRNSRGRSHPLEVFTDRLALLFAKLANAQGNTPWRIRTRIPETTPNYDFHDIESIAPEEGSDNQNTVITLRTAPTGIAAKSKVTIHVPSDDLYLKGLKGTHRVLAVPENTRTIIVNAYYYPAVPVYKPTASRLRLLGYLHVPITKAEFITFGSKKVGPAKAPRGRDVGVSYRHRR